MRKILTAFVVVLFIFCFHPLSTVFAATSWTELQPAGNTTQQWNALATSSDGQTVLAGVYGGRLYLSTNRGASWNEVQPAGNTNGSWQGVAMSPDGQKIVAGNYGGRLYLSTNRGTSWNEVQPAGNVTNEWVAVGISDDGQKILAAAQLGRIYLSSNGGTNWTETQPAGNSTQSWYATAVSGDGQTLYAGVNSGRLYVSTNGGTSWTETQPAGNVNRSWRSIAVSNNGLTAFVVAESGSSVYKTSNQGSSWTAVQADSVDPFFTSISMSSNLQTVFATGGNDWMYMSFDSGVTWSKDAFTSSADYGWNTGALSQDGRYFYAGEWIGRLYRGTISSPSSSVYTHPSSTEPPPCHDVVPSGTVDLFQINRSGSTAWLFFTPAKDVGQYHVVYGYQQGDERFGSHENGNNGTGIQSVSIHDLNPTISYWFKIIPVNGCSTGNWSNWLVGGTDKKSFFRY